MENTNKNNPQRTQLGTIQSKNWESDLIINASLFHIDFIHTSYQINRRINPSTFPIGMIQEFGNISLPYLLIEILITTKKWDLE